MMPNKDCKKRYRERHKELGLCVDCARPATRGLRCEYHAQRNVENKAKWRKQTGRDKKSSLPETSIRKEFTGEQLIITTKSLNIQTLEDALTESKVDLDKYEVDRYSINSWEVTMHGSKEGEPPKTYTNYQVKVFLKPKVPDPMETAIIKLIEKIPVFDPPKDEQDIEESDYALEMALYDAHFGKLAWGPETEQGSYDIGIAAHTFIMAAKKNLDFASPYKLSKIFFPFGQDFMHVENYQGTTAIDKNILDTDSRLPKILQTAIASIFEVVELCRNVAPVELLWVPGNHDMHASYYISEIIKQRFRNDECVTVDNSPPWRKARLWGNLLVGFTHDANIRQANVVNMLPQFFPELWGKSKYREWHTGHKHTKKEWKYMPVTSAGGTIIRQIPTLSTIDAWHYQEGFVDAIPAGESFIWSKRDGIIAHYTAYVGYVGSH